MDKVVNHRISSSPHAGGGDSRYFSFCFLYIGKTLMYQGLEIFMKKTEFFILVYVKFLFTVIESILFLPKIHRVSQVFRMYVVLVLFILFYSSLDMQSL